VNRRRFLLSGSSVGALVVAGCVSEQDDGNGADDDTGSDAKTGSNGGSGADDDAADNGAESTPEVTQVSVTGEDHTPETAITTVTINFATNTVAELEPPDSSTDSPDSGYKFIVVHTEVTVESELDRQIEVYGSFLGLQADGIVYDRQPIHNLPSMSQTVVPTATYDAWQRFEVPEDVTEAMLVAVHPRDWFGHPTEIRFVEDTSLSGTMPEE